MILSTKKDRLIKEADCEAIMKKTCNTLVRDLAISIIILILIYGIGIFFWKETLNIFLKIPGMRMVYDIINAEIQKKSVVGLSVITFVGGLFFLGYPGDILFMSYILAGYSIFRIAFLITFWSTLAQTINYGIGFLIEKKVIEIFVKEHKRTYIDTLKKFDAYFIIIINMLPLPADILSVLLGLIRYDFKRAMLFTVIGRILKMVFYILLFAVVRVWT